MLTPRLQVIEGTRTFTPQDLYPCRLLHLLAQLPLADIVTGGSWVDALLRLAGRDFGGGASSVSSIIMSLVANFLGPWRWKSMEVRSALNAGVDPAVRMKRVGHTNIRTNLIYSHADLALQRS